MMPALPEPSRGEIWFADVPTDPPGKGPRPVLIVSPNRRNKHPRATTVLVVPFSTTLSDFPLHIRLAPGQSELPAISELRPEQITAVRKEWLKNRVGTRVQSERLITQIARAVVLCLGVHPKDIA